jgi:hypothetical protein
MLSVAFYLLFMFNVVMLNVVMLNVVAPNPNLTHKISQAQ